MRKLYDLKPQLSKLYDEFVQVNGSASFDEFLAEEFPGPFSLPEDNSADEPFEKERHPVPVDLITVNANIIFYKVAAEIEIQPEPVPVISIVPFTVNFNGTKLDPVFHPPIPLAFSLA